MNNQDLYTAAQLAEMLGISRQGLNKAIKADRIEDSKYYIASNRIKAWTPEQVERIKRTFVKERD